MKASLLFLAVVCLTIWLHTSREGQASELSQLLENEMEELKEEIEKRSGPSRKPCGFTWRCKRRRSRRSRSKFWGKRNGISHGRTSFSLGADDFDGEFKEEEMVEK